MASTSTTTMFAPMTTTAASPIPGLAGERITKEGVGPGSRSRGRSLVGGQSTGHGEGDDGLKTLPSEGSRTDALLSRRSRGLGGEEGHGECSFGQSSLGDGRRPAEGSGGERCVGSVGARGARGGVLGARGGGVSGARGLRGGGRRRLGQGRCRGRGHGAGALGPRSRRAAPEAGAAAWGHGRAAP